MLSQRRERELLWNNVNRNWISGSLFNVSLRGTVFQVRLRLSSTGSTPLSSPMPRVQIHYLSSMLLERLLTRNKVTRLRNSLDLRLGFQESNIHLRQLTISRELYTNKLLRPLSQSLLKRILLDLLLPLPLHLQRFLNNTRGEQVRRVLGRMESLDLLREERIFTPNLPLKPSPLRKKQLLLDLS